MRKLHLCAFSFDFTGALCLRRLSTWSPGAAAAAVPALVPARAALPAALLLASAPPPWRPACLHCGLPRRCGRVATPPPPHRPPPLAGSAPPRADPAANVREKEIKRQTLLELVDYVNSGSGKFTEQVRRWWWEEGEATAAAVGVVATRWLRLQLGVAGVALLLLLSRRARDQQGQAACECSHWACLVPAVLLWFPPAGGARHRLHAHRQPVPRAAPAQGARRAAPRLPRPPRRALLPLPAGCCRASLPRRTPSGQPADGAPGRICPFLKQAWLLAKLACCPSLQAESFDLDEEEPNLEPAWPHLQVGAGQRSRRAGVWPPPGCRRAAAGLVFGRRRAAAGLRPGRRLVAQLGCPLACCGRSLGGRGRAGVAGQPRCDPALGRAPAPLRPPAVDPLSQ